MLLGSLIHFAASTSEGSSDWAIAAVSAAFGAGLTILGEILRNLLLDRKRFKSARLRLVAEIEQIEAEAIARIARETSDSIPLDAPMPTNSWELILAGNFAMNFDNKQLSILSDFYGLVESANHLSKQVPTMVMVSVMDEGAIGQAFLSRAREFASEPAEQIVGAAPAALIASGKGV